MFTTQVAGSLIIILIFILLLQELKLELKLKQENEIKTGDLLLDRKKLIALGRLYQSLVGFANTVIDFVSTFLIFFSLTEMVCSQNLGLENAEQETRTTSNHQCSRTSTPKYAKL